MDVPEPVLMCTYKEQKSSKRFHSYCSMSFQEENAKLREDAKALIEAQHSELVSSEQRVARLHEDLDAARSLLSEMRAALEAALAQSGEAKASASELDNMQKELQGCRCCCSSQTALRWSLDSC
jgi:septal ring factor EnvC (AmiA/AmiB activator)